MLEQGNKYNIPHLKVSLETIFFRNDSSKQKSFHLSARELRDECSASISVEIICFEHWQEGSYDKLNPGIFLQGYVQPNASQVTTMMALWKIITVFRSSSWNLPSPHYVTYFVRQTLQKFTGKVTSKVPFHEISSENIHFCGLKKETFVSNGRKI